MGRAFRHLARRTIGVKTTQADGYPTLWRTETFGTVEIAAAPAALVVTGVEAAVLCGRRLDGEAASFAAAGQAAHSAQGRVLAAGAGPIVLAGQETAFLRGYVAASETGEFVLDGQDALGWHGLVAEAGRADLVLDGREAWLLATRALAAAAGAFTQAGEVSEGSRVGPSAAGGFTLTPKKARLRTRPWLSYLPHRAVTMPADALPVVHPGDALAELLRPADALPVVHPLEALSVLQPSDALPVAQPEEV